VAVVRLDWTPVAVFTRVTLLSQPPARMSLLPEHASNGVRLSKQRGAHATMSSRYFDMISGWKSEYTGRF